MNGKAQTEPSAALPPVVMHELDDDEEEEEEEEPSVMVVMVPSGQMSSDGPLHDPVHNVPAGQAWLQRSTRHQLD